MKLARWGRPWPAPAKLNLFLHVIGRRADGFHDLQTAFQFLDHGDSVRFEPRRDDRIGRPTGLPGLDPEEDLVVRAARLLREIAGVRRGVDIHVTKRLPAGGGLGGGSSDAATTLVALNLLWKLGLDQAVLADAGRRLGSDVPVFVGGQAAFAEGVGDELTPVDLPRPWYLVVFPGCPVETRSVFAAPELTRNTPETTIAGFLCDGGRNDFEPVVRARFPAVAELLDWLSGYGPARMTGTGSCVFLAFENEVMARAVREQVPADWTAFVARGLNRSPLLAYGSAST